MAENENGQDKTELPTPKRLQQMMESGQFARSMEIPTVLIVAAGLLVLTIMAPRMVDTLKLYMMAIFSQIGSMTITADSFPAHFARFMTMAGTCILPVMAAAVVAGRISGGMQSKFRISPKALKPKFSKLSPLKGFKNIFSSRSLVKLGTTLAKLVVIFGLTWPVILDTLRNPIFYTTLDLSHLLIFMGETMQTVFLRVLVGMIIIAAVDYSYQMWKHEQDSMMTKEEVKEENKNNEGNPEVKGEQRRRRRQMLLQTLNQEIPQADVVVTNPTHLAIALRYDREKMDAPRVVAKGARYNALRIREIAQRHQVPIVENNPVARLLFKHCKVGTAIIPDLFAAVAEILAYVYRTNRYRYYRRGEQLPV